MLLKNPQDFIQLLTRQAGIVGQGRIRRQPKLRFSVGTRHVNVQPLFLSGEEVESITSLSKYRWAHG
jgi:hypothetical protein